MVTKLKRLPTEWKKIFASYISDKELITGSYRELKTLNFQKINDPMKKWAIKQNRALKRKEIQMAKKQMNKCSTSLVIKEIQIKTTLILHLTPIGTQATINVCLM
jgi:hypothetical protein